jgi:diguanylate cyclase (GGDEF)-like protein
MMSAIDVLVVDDDEASLRGLLSALAALGYCCRRARDGQEALEEQEREPAAIVLTDWSMPRRDGFELCQALKERPAPPYVILMTAQGERTRLFDAIRGGADEFLRKPIDLDELEVRLLAAVRLVRAQRELADLNQRLRRDSANDFRIARTDALTSIANRLRLDEDLARALAEAGRYGRRYSIAICDVDNFKAYNDVNGHLAGDVALRRIATALRDEMRAADTVDRYGGEEFLVLLPEQNAAEAARAMVAFDRSSKRSRSRERRRRCTMSSRSAPALPSSEGVRGGIPGSREPTRHSIGRKRTVETACGLPRTGPRRSRFEPCASSRAARPVA